MADTDDSHLTIALDEGCWQPWLDSVEIKPLYEVGVGGYLLAHQGALLARIGSPTGATILLRGAVPQACHLLG